MSDICSIRFFKDCQSKPNPLLIYEWQSKSNFEIGLTIQSKSNQNQTNILVEKLSAEDYFAISNNGSPEIQLTPNHNVKTVV